MYYSYFYLLLKKFVLKTDDSIGTTLNKQNLLELGEVKWKDMNLHIFFNLVPAYTDTQFEITGYDTYKKYLNVYAEHMYLDTVKYSKGDKDAYVSNIH